MFCNINSSFFAERGSYRQMCLEAFAYTKTDDRGGNPEVVLTSHMPINMYTLRVEFDFYDEN